MFYFRFFAKIIKPICKITNYNIYLKLNKGNIRKHNNNMKKLIFVFLIVIYFAILSYSHSSIDVESIRIVNYSNTIPINPIFIVEMDYKIKEKLQTHHNNHNLKFIISTPSKNEEFILGQNTLFNHILSNRIRLYLPVFHKLPPNRKLEITFQVVEGKEKIFTTNINIFVSNYQELPIFIGNTGKIEISRSIPRPTIINFLHQESQTGIIKSPKITEKLQSKQSPQIKGLKYFEYKFREEGKYDITIGKTNFSVEIVFDKTPPYFIILTPSNNSSFFRTNNIIIKWSDPQDISGINFSNSSLTIKNDSGEIITNITPLVALNRESSITPYEIITLSLKEGNYECSIIYSDFDNNSTNITTKFKILPSIQDREKPILKKIFFEGSTKLSDNEFLVPTSTVMFIEASDGEYGSGVKSINYILDNQIFSEQMLSEIKYIYLTLTNKISTLEIWLEDYGGNSSETNRFILKQKSQP